MPTIEKRLGVLEKRFLRERKVFTFQPVVFDIAKDTPEEHERKIRQIAEIEASGGEAIVVNIVR